MLLVLLCIQDVDSVLADMDRHSAEIRTMTSQYEHVKRLSLLDEETRTTGLLLFRRENRAVRWEEKTGGAIQQLDGDRYVAVFPKLKEVEIYTVDQKGKQLASIMGAPDISKTLKQDFDIALGPRQNGEIELQLKPRSEDVRKRVKEALIRISADRFLLTFVSYVEPNGDSVEIRFRQTKVNEKLPLKAFEIDLDAMAKAGFTITRH
ncbi:MAG: outer membrane lipoprotein carrier protein LolA [Planctomycetes bacterium]|nr:outer membrane lipoprotein carrier protein LolA [Planctomycetota bacterium]